MNNENKFKEAEEKLISVIKNNHPYGNRISDTDIRHMEAFDYAVRAMVDFAKPEPMPNLNTYVKDQVNKAVDEIARRIKESSQQEFDNNNAPLTDEQIDSIVEQLKKEITP